MDQDASRLRSEAQPSFQFISVTKQNYVPGKLPQHAAVRRHVMLDRRRRERIAAVEQFQQSRMQNDLAKLSIHTASAVDITPEEDTLPEEMEITTEESSDSVLQRQLVKEHPAAWMIDPFGSFAAPMDNNTQAGLEYYAKIMVPSTRPGDLASQNRHTHDMIFFALCGDMTRDSFTAMLTIAQAMKVYASESTNRQARPYKMNGSDLGSISQFQHATVSDTRQGSAQALMVKGLAYVNKASRKLNQQVLNSGFSPDDAMIGTVLALLVCEILMGDTSRGEIHCQGLAGMVNARGGPNFVLKFMMPSVFLSDMHMATMSHRCPSYPLLDMHRSSLQTNLPQVCSTFGLSPYRCELLTLSNNLVARFDQGFNTSLEQLQDIVNYMNSFGITPLKVPEELRTLYLSKIFAVEHGVLSQIQPHTTDISRGIEDFCIIAVLLFIYTSIQKWNPYSPLVRIVVRQLQNSLTQTNIHTLLALDSNFLLWSLFIGAHASFGQVTRSWFVAKIRRVTSRLLVKYWIDVQVPLTMCYYIDNIFEEAFADIWLEVQDETA